MFGNTSCAVSSTLVLHCFIKNCSNIHDFGCFQTAAAGHNINLSESNTPRLHQDQQQCWRLSKWLEDELRSSIISRVSLRKLWTRPIVLSSSHPSKKSPKLPQSYLSTPHPRNPQRFQLHHPLQWSSHIFGPMAMMAIVAFVGEDGG